MPRETLRRILRSAEQDALVEDEVEELILGPVRDFTMMFAFPLDCDIIKQKIYYV